MSSEVTVGIIGAGVSGLAAGLAMQRRGVPFTIFEKADEVGGTWRENRYPGLTIDVPSAIYTFEGYRNPHWRRLLPDQAEILAYHRDMSFASGLRSAIRFGSEVVSARWTGADWEIELGDGTVESFRVLVCATGFLHHPRIPAIEGLERFAGETMHSAQWRDDVAVAGRRVGVIGSGSTGVQLVTALAGVAAHVTSFQRTPQWVFPAPNMTIPLAVRRLLARRPALNDWLVARVEWFADWLLAGAAVKAGRRRRMLEVLGRRHLSTVADPALRAKLTPPDVVLCKRPVVSSGYYRAVQRPDVWVADMAIDRVEPAGVRTSDGVLHELDVLVLATGFQAHNYMRPMRVVGEDGLDLDTAWRDGPYGYRTMAIPGFPNLFMVLGPHIPLLSFPLHTSAELQSEYIGQIVDLLGCGEVASVDARPEAAGAWLKELSAGMDGTVWTGGCTSWYLGEGSVPVLWPYDRRRWRETLKAPVLADYRLRAADGGPSASSTIRARTTSGASSGTKWPAPSTSSTA